MSYAGATRTNPSTGATETWAPNLYGDGGGWQVTAPAQAATGPVGTPTQRILNKLGPQHTVMTPDNYYFTDPDRGMYVSGDGKLQWKLTRDGAGNQTFVDTSGNPLDEATLNRIANMDPLGTTSSGQQSEDPVLALYRDLVGGAGGGGWSVGGGGGFAPPQAGGDYDDLGDLLELMKAQSQSANSRAQYARSAEGFSEALGVANTQAQSFAQAQRQAAENQAASMGLNPHRFAAIQQQANLDAIRQGVGAFQQARTAQQSYADQLGSQAFQQMGALGQLRNQKQQIRNTYDVGMGQVGASYAQANASLANAHSNALNARASALNGLGNYVNTAADNRRQDAVANSDIAMKYAQLDQNQQQTYMAVGGSPGFSMGHGLAGARLGYDLYNNSRGGSNPLPAGPAPAPTPELGTGTGLGFSGILP